MIKDFNPIPPKPWGRSLAALVTVACIASNAPAEAGAQTQSLRAFNIQAQPLTQALTQFAKQSGIFLAYSASLTQGLKSPGVKGNLTPSDALGQLLEGTGLIIRTTREGSLTLEKMPINQPVDSKGAALSKVTVTAKVEDEPTAYKVTNANTATKTDTPIMETPYSIQVIPEQVLKDQQVVRINDALDNVSGVFRGQSSGGFYEQIVMRGFDSGWTNGIVAYRDGYPYGTGLVASGREMANIERVEVLKGPASILYGRSQPGGIVNYVTKQPLSAPYYSLQQQFGSYGFFRTTADATGPLSKDGSLLYRLNFAYENSATFKNLGDRGDRAFIAPVLQWNIGDRTQVKLELEHREGNTVYDPGTVSMNGKIGVVPGSRFLSHAISSPIEDTLVGLNLTHAFNDQWTLRHRFNAFFTRRYDFSPTPGSLASNGDLSLNTAYVAGGERTYFTSLDLTGKFSTFGLDHTVLLGGDYYTKSNDWHLSVSQTTLNIFNPVYLNEAQLNASLNPFSFNYSQSNQWFGLFLQDQIKLPYHFHMLAGFRYDSMASGSVFNGSGSPVPRQDRVTPRGGLLWQPVPEFSIYSSYSENVQSVDGITPGGSSLTPQSAQQWEAGFKTELLDKRFSGTLAWFDLTKQNIGASDPLNSVFSIPIGEAHSKGLELDLKGEIIPGLNLIGTYTYTPEANITKGNANSYPPLGRTLNVPVHGASFWTNYELMDGTLKGLKFGSGVIVRSQSQGDLDGSFQLPGYATLNLMTGYGWKVGASKVNLQLNVNNLLDKDYYPSAFSKLRIEVGQPRTVMGSVKVEF